MRRPTGQPHDGEDLPAVVAELYDIEMLTVEQAVMKLELSESPMLMFRNAAHFGLNVVHRREDGCWLDRPAWGSASTTDQAVTTPGH